MFEIIISKQDCLCTRVFSSPKYIHCRNIFKRGKDHSQHPRLQFFYSICQKFCSWHNSLILFNLCSLKPAMNLIISRLGFEHMLFFLFWATHWGTQQLFPGRDTAAYGWCDGISISLAVHWLVLGAFRNMAQHSAIIMNISTISLLVSQAAGPPGKSAWATVLCFCRLLSHKKAVTSRKLVLGGSVPKCW